MSMDSDPDFSEARQRRLDHDETIVYRLVHDATLELGLAVARRLVSFRFGTACRIGRVLSQTTE